MRSKKMNVQIMVEVSLLVAAAMVLSMLKLFQMPQGGSVSLDMLPIFILAFRRGGNIGILGGALLGFLKLLISPYYVHPVQVLLDYPVPFAVLGVAGYFRNNKLFGVGLGAFLRFVVHVVAGVVFFADYAPEGVPALIYSITYNAPFIIAETLLVAVAVHLLSRRRDILEPRVH